MFTFILKDFVRHRSRFVAQIRAKVCVRAGNLAYLRDHAEQNHWLRVRTLELSQGVGPCLSLPILSLNGQHPIQARYLRYRRKPENRVCIIAGLTLTDSN